MLERQNRLSKSTLVTMLCGFVTVNLACNGETDKHQGGDETAESTGNLDTTGAGSTTAGGNDTTEGSSPEDANYPAPIPFTPQGICPQSTFGPVSFSGQGLACAPPCAGQGQCPGGETGSALPVCAFNPSSSGAPCTMMGSATECPNANETCVPTAGGGLGCLAASTHCILTCVAPGMCPDSMACTVAGVCEYINDPNA